MNDSSPNPRQPLGSTGLACHPLGFGCYRVVKGDAEHEAALGTYLERGGNLIDTSANYGDGSSEELVGQVIAGVPREKIILVTKGGYIQGRNMILAQQRRFPEVVEYGPGIWHSIHPEFLETQIDLSRERLRQEYIDVYLLHNPEYFLEDISHRRELTAADHDEFYRRIAEAFRFLESKVSAGVIGWYGVSSNNFPLCSSRPAMASIARCLEQAERVSASHHFRVVQLPLNLFEAGAALTENNNGLTALAFCRERGLAVLANRPLNAFHEDQLVRLADFAAPGAEPPGIDQLRRDLGPLEDHERIFEQRMGERMRLASGGTATELLLEITPQLWSVAHWEQVAGRHVVEPLQAWLIQTQQRLQPNPAWQEWRSRFIELIRPALDLVGAHLAAKQQKTSDQLRQRLVAAGYPETTRSLSRMALDVLAGLDGLSCTLVGMRRREYVDDALGAEKLTGVDSIELLRKFNSPST
jgi:aryl-alcohol dehydrogenase-like predicted oxidoreductase